MLVTPTFQGTKLTSSTQLATQPGAIIRGIFVSAKGTSPSITVYDSATGSATGKDLVPAHVPTGVGWLEYGGLGCGTGLYVKVASATVVVAWQPPAVGANI